MRKHVEESVATGAAAGRGRGGRFSAGRKPYRFARTMPECPHWYTLWTSWTADGTEDAWTDELDRLWGCVVGHIRIYCVPEQYVAPDGHTWLGDVSVRQ